MCGLVSLISKHSMGFFNDDTKIFTEMLFADQLRGSNGTGIFYDNGKQIKVLKAPYAASDFITDKSYGKAMTEINKYASFVVGHNRAATIGSLTHQNTHPFRCGHITLVHNGTLASHAHLADTENDSHAIASSIAKIGFRETIKKINGAYALIWFDERQKTLNFCRNIQRPMWLVETKDLFCFISEPKLAEWVLDRNKEKVIKVSEVPTMTLVQFEAGKWDNYETSPFTGYTYTPPVFTTTSYKNPHSTPSTPSTNSMIGKEINFIPTGLDPAQKTKVIGFWKDPATGKDTECRFWATSAKQAEELVKAQVLRGFISHSGYQTNDKKDFFIIRTAYEPKIALLTHTKIKKEEVTSANGVKLDPKQVEQVSKTLCLCCSGQIGNLISACEVYEEDGSLSGMCPDCTSHMYDNLTRGMMQ